MVMSLTRTSGLAAGLVPQPRRPCGVGRGAFYLAGHSVADMQQWLVGMPRRAIRASLSHADLGQWVMTHIFKTGDTYLLHSDVAGRCRVEVDVKP